MGVYGTDGANVDRMVVMLPERRKSTHFHTYVYKS